MDPNNAQHQSLIPHPPLEPALQSWTTDGCPIVNGKYLDLTTGEVKTHDDGLVTGGPPSLSVYWHNRSPKPHHDKDQPFYSLSGFRQMTVTDYLAKVGDLLKTGVYTVNAMTATKYSVNLLIITPLTNGGFREALGRHGLLYVGASLGVGS